ncbi:MAG: helix-turn-helix domain-containing protein [Tissierellia bacterium]|nr:helix-turn-helix domain-containing protein [Tissierellia bacterium]
MNIGDKIKQLRLQLGLTQEELAERSELTKGFISQIERDLTSPSVDSLEDLLEALGTSLSEFFKEEVDRRIVFREEDYYISKDEQSGVSISWIVPNAQKNRMEPIRLELTEKGHSKEYSPHEGEEFGYVLKGKIHLTVNGVEHLLKKGECFYTGGENTRKLSNAARGKSEVLWISTPPSF